MRTSKETINAKKPAFDTPPVHYHFNPNPHQQTPPSPLRSPTHGFPSPIFCPTNLPLPFFFRSAAVLPASAMMDLEYSFSNQLRQGTLNSTRHRTQDLKT